MFHSGCCFLHNSILNTLKESPHDAVGNRTADDAYTYEYDAFGRLRKVKAASGGALVAEYRYHGLGERLAWRYDSGGTAGIEGTMGSAA